MQLAVNYHTTIHIPGKYIICIMIVLYIQSPILEQNKFD